MTSDCESWLWEREEQYGYSTGCIRTGSRSCSALRKYEKEPEAQVWEESGTIVEMRLLHGDYGEVYGTALPPMGSAESDMFSNLRHCVLASACSNRIKSSYTPHPHVTTSSFSLLFHWTPIRLHPPYFLPLEPPHRNTAARNLIDARPSL